MKKRFSLVILLSLFSLSGCYEQVSFRVIPIGDSDDDPVSWTGSSDVGAHHVIGLAGQDVYYFHGRDSGVTAPHKDKYSRHFSGPHELTSYAQTFGVGHHERAFVHGNLIGRTDNLNLISDHDGGSIPPLGEVYVSDGERHFRIRQICDMAAPDQDTGWILPESLDSHLLISFRACENGGGQCVGGVAELSVSSHWTVRSSRHGQHAILRKPNGQFFSDECMPMSSTSQVTHWSESHLESNRLAVLDPSMNAVNIYESENLWQGVIETVYLEGDGTPKDVYIDGFIESDSRYSFLTVLHENTSANTISHYWATNDTMILSPHIVEPVPRDVTFIQGGSHGYSMRFDGYKTTLYRLGNLPTQVVYEGTL